MSADWAIWFWVAVSVTLLTLEVTAVAGIGFLYAGMAALTVAFLVAFSWIEPSSALAQTAVFLFASGVWAGLLWIPMKKMLRRENSGYSDMIGTSAVVYGEDLVRGRSGRVKWSGAVMRAELDGENEPANAIAAGATVIVTGKRGNLLYVALRAPADGGAPE